MTTKEIVRRAREGSLSRTSGSSRQIWLIAALAIVVLGAGALAGWLLPSPPAAPTPAPLAAQASVPEDWTEADEDACMAAGRAALEEPVPDAFGLANQAVTDSNYALVATHLACLSARKVNRFCDGTSKAGLVAAIDDYVFRLDIVVAGLGLQSGWIATVTKAVPDGTGHETDAFESMHDDTLGYMQLYHAKVVNSLRALIAGGILSRSDFGFFGFGASGTIASLFDKTEPAAPICR